MTQVAHYYDWVFLCKNMRCPSCPTPGNCEVWEKLKHIRISKTPPKRLALLYLAELRRAQAARESTHD